MKPIEKLSDEIKPWKSEGKSQKLLLAYVCLLSFENIK